MEYQLKTKQDTKKLATQITKNIETSKIILLYGDLGVGKTFLSQNIIKNLTKIKKPIQSPTFNILQIYKLDTKEIHHYDLYRIKDISELYELDIEESLRQHITIIEWPEIISEYINNNYPATNIFLKMENGQRVAQIKDYKR